MFTQDDGQDIGGAEDEVCLLSASETPQIELDGVKTNFLLYNCGTEMAPATMYIAGGDGEDVIITNHTTGQQCIIKGMTTTNTTDVNIYLKVDAETGQVWKIGAFETMLAFDMHDRGYLWLAPSAEFAKDIEVAYEADSSVITGSEFYDTMVGQYIYLAGEWVKITAFVSDTQLEINKTMAAGGSE